MTSTRAINAAVAVIHACLRQGKTLPATQAYALDSAGLLNSPEHAAEVEQLRKLPAMVDGLMSQVVALQSEVSELAAAAMRARRERDDMRERVSEPYGCQHCGIAKRSHGRRWMTGVGVHGWTAPSQGQIAERMKARRAVHVAADVAKLRARVAELEAAAACIGFGVRLTADAPSVELRSTNREFVEEQLASLRGSYPDARLVQLDTRHGAWTDVPVVASCLGCGEGLDDENISDFCSDRCAEAGSNRPVDEDPIAYSLTVEALHASSGAVIETPGVYPQGTAHRQQMRDLLARQQAAVEATHETPPRPRPVPHDLPEVTASDAIEYGIATDNEYGQRVLDPSPHLDASLERLARCQAVWPNSRLVQGTNGGEWAEVTP